jgi:cyclopropane-fatty-acyl-phospholipid synthase
MSARASRDPARGRSPAGLLPAERWSIRRALRALGDPPFSLVVWTGEEFAPRGAPPEGRLRLLARPRLRELAAGPDSLLANAYVEGRLEIEGDLPRLIEAAFRASDRSPRWVRRAAALAALQPRRRTPAGARRNAQRHYDVGNEFYRLWLDERMVYTCAYFAQPWASLEEAQLAKLEHVCRKLRLERDERVVEAGSGWGALALHMAERHGVRVTAFNVSSEQTRHAREVARARGLAGRVDFVEDDWREIRGRYDAFVSIGMLEHVGRSRYSELGRVIARALAPEGRGLLHFIGHQRPIPMNRWLERNIFPGAYIPALSEALAVLESQRFAPVDVENLRRHYARTLEHWLERFEKAAPQIRALRGEAFERTWRLYLASSLASFRTGWCQLYQVLFARRDDERLPWTREWMARRPGAAGAPD